MHNGAPDAPPKAALPHGMQGTVRSLPPKLLREPPAPRFQVQLVGDGQVGEGLATAAGEV